MDGLPPTAHVTIFDYPPFQLLPAEVQQYLLLQFLEFGTTVSGLIPKETALLANYPNPFNPETWIPYQLSTPANVSIAIYAVDGKLVRRLDLGHQAVGIYESRSRAAYWDGKNADGEAVASGVYFLYTDSGRVYCDAENANTEIKGEIYNENQIMFNSNNAYFNMCIYHRHLLSSG